MRQHVHEIIHDDIEWIIEQVEDVIFQLFATSVSGHFGIGRFYLQTQTLQLFFHEKLFVHILAFFIFIADPFIGVFFVDIQRRQSGEDGIAAVLSGGGQDGIKVLFLLFNKQFIEHRFYDLELIITEIVNEYENGRHLLTDEWRNFIFYQVVRKGRCTGWIFHPGWILLADELEEFLVGLIFLHFKDLMHLVVIGFVQFQFPENKLLIQFRPFLMIHVVVDLNHNLLEFLTIGAAGFFRNEPFIVDDFFEGKQYLIGFHRFDQVVTDLRADGFIHQILFFIFGDEHHRNIFDDFQPRKRFQSGNAGHTFIQKNYVVVVLFYFVQCIMTVGNRIYRIAFLLQEHDLRFQEIDFIVGPENFYDRHSC